MTSPFLGFWRSLHRPIIGLSPMDGVTDFACRYITARYGRPDVIFTEFTTAEGLFYAPERILRDFEYNEIERPVVAQIYGHRPEDFYRATHVVCELGFDGVDINMGCPSKQVVQKNCGAKLITVPDLALEIIRATRSAIEDWVKGQTLEDLKVPEKLIETVSQMNVKRVGSERRSRRQPIPYSVKTRIGFDSVVIESWMETLLQEQPAAISIHGRTLKQLYRGAASWEAIARAVQVARGSGTLVLGNGDITSREMALHQVETTGVDGILIGRSAIGNPWIFHPLPLIRLAPAKPDASAQTRGRIPILPRTPIGVTSPHSAEMLRTENLVGRRERIDVALEHARYFTESRGEICFRVVRKHLIGYLSHFPEAAVFRSRALRTASLRELTELLF